MIRGTKHLPVNFCRTVALSIKATTAIRRKLGCCAVLTSSTMNSTGVNTCSPGESQTAEKETPWITHRLTEGTGNWSYFRYK